MTRMENGFMICLIHRGRNGVNDLTKSQIHVVYFTRVGGSTMPMASSPIGFQSCTLIFIFVSKQYRSFKIMASSTRACNPDAATAPTRCQLSKNLPTENVLEERSRISLLSNQSVMTFAKSEVNISATQIIEPIL